MTQIISMAEPFSRVQNDGDQLNQTAWGIQDWCGRGISVVGTGISAVGNSLISTTENFFTGVNCVASDAPALAGVFRKLDQHVLRFFEHIQDAKGSLSQFGDFIRRNVAIIDFVQLVVDIDYFAAGRFREKRNEKGEIEKPRDNDTIITGKLAFFVADIGGSLLWFQELGFLSLSKAANAIGQARVLTFVPTIISSIPVLRDCSALEKVANAIGQFRVFSFVPHLNCLSVTLRALDLGYALFAVDAGRRLLNADNNKNQTISAGIDLSSYLAELTLSTLVLAGMTNVVGLGIVGTTCITLTVASFLYRITHENELKQKIQLPAPAVMA